jgi:hypothetical protein
VITITIANQCKLTFHQQGTALRVDIGLSRGCSDATPAALVITNDDYIDILPTPKTSSGTTNDNNDKIENDRNNNIETKLA